MRWHLNDNSWSWLWFLDAADREVPVILFQIVVLGEFVDASDLKDSAVGDKRFAEFDLVARQVSITDELLTRLVHIERLGQSLSSQVDGEGVSSVIREVHLSDLNCVVGKEVMPLELQVSTLCVESENFSIVIQELFLRRYSTTT